MYSTVVQHLHRANWLLFIALKATFILIFIICSLVFLRVFHATTSMPLRGYCIHIYTSPNEFVHLTCLQLQLGNAIYVCKYKRQKNPLISSQQLCYSLCSASIQTRHYKAVFFSISLSLLEHRRYTIKFFVRALKAE